MEVKRTLIPKKGGTTIINKGFTTTTNDNINIDTNNFNVTNLTAKTITTDSITSINGQFGYLGATTGDIQTLNTSYINAPNNLNVNVTNDTNLNSGGNININTDKAISISSNFGMDIEGDITTHDNVTHTYNTNPYDRIVDMEDVVVKLGSHNTFDELTGSANSTLYANSITADYLTVLRSAHFFELIIDKIKAAGGSVIFTAADGFKIDKVTSSSSTYTLYWIACTEVAEGNNGQTLSQTGQTLTENVSINMWKKWDQALCQSFNLSGGAGTYQDVSNTYWWRVVESVSEEPVIQTIDGTKYYCHWIKVYRSGQYVAQNSDNPLVGDEVAMLGYRYNELQNPSQDDIDRSSAIMISAYKTIDTGVKPPSYVQYQNITDFNLSSHRKTYIDATGAHIIGTLEAGTTVDPNVNIPISFENWSFAGVPVIIKNTNDTFTPSTFTLKILYVSDSQSVLYDTIPSGTQLFVNNTQVYSTTIVSTAVINLRLVDSTSNKILCASTIYANDVELINNVADGTDGDFYEMIYKVYDIDDTVSRTELPASLEKKFYNYTQVEAKGWSQTAPPTNTYMENLWMSQRFVKHTVESYDPSVITSPVIMADKSDIILQVDPNGTTSAGIRVTGHLLTENVAVTLTDTNNVFTISSNSLNYENVNGNGVMLNVEFTSSTAGNYTGTITLTSTGANTVTINLVAVCSSDDLASNNYLNVKKYASISTVGWDPTKVNNIYKYTENAEAGNAWLVMSVYGAFSSIHENYTQNWIDTDVTFDTSTSITDGAWTTINSDVWLGSDYYFTDTTPKSVGAEALLSTSGSSVTFFVSNVNAVKLYGHNRTWTGTAEHPMSITVYECTVSGGTVTPASEYTAQASSNAKNTDVNIEIENLDYTKVYKVVCKEERGTMHEVAFCTPITKDSDTAHQDDRVVVITWGDWSNPIRINGNNGEDGADGDGWQYIYHRTSDDTQPTFFQSYADVPNPTALSDTTIEYQIRPGDPGYDSDTNLIQRWADAYSNSHSRRNINYIPPETQTGSTLSTGWTDDPMGVDEYFLYEWISSRHYDGWTKEWSEYSEPVIWAKYGLDGTDGLNGTNGQDGQDGENGEYWMLMPIRNDFSVRINEPDNYGEITGRLNVDLAFGVVHVNGNDVEWITSAQMAAYSMNLITDNATTGGQRNTNNGIQYNNQTVTINGTTIPVLTYTHSNYLEYTANTLSGNNINYYYLHEHNLTNRMPTRMTVELVRNGDKVNTYNINLIFKPDHLFTVTEAALNSIYQGLSGDVNGTYTTGFSTIKQQWDSINLSVNNVKKIANGSFPENNEYEEFAYWRRTTNTTPAKPVGDVTVTTATDGQWTMYQMEPSQSRQYVFITKRTKPTDSLTHATDVWSVWSDPILFQMYGSPRGFVNGASLKITADGITSNVASTYETKSDANTTKTQLQSQIQQTADSILSTVSSTYVTQSDAANTYATQTAMQSAIQQSASSIMSTVSATYVTQTDASNTYETQSHASSTYTTQSQVTQTATSISAQVQTNIEGELSSTGIDVEQGKITLSANNTIIQGDLDLHGNFTSENSSLMNKAVIDSMNGGIRLYGPDSVDANGEPTQNAQQKLITDIGYGTDPDSNARYGYAQFYDAKHPEYNATIDNETLYITDPYNTVNIGSSGISWHDNQNNSGGLEMSQLLFRRLRVAKPNANWYDAKMTDDMITSDYDGAMSINLPDPWTSDGKFYFIKHKKDKNTNIRCTAAENRGDSVIMNDDSESVDWQRNVQNNSTLIFCDGIHWILMELDY